MCEFDDCSRSRVEMEYGLGGVGLKRSSVQEE